MKWKSPFIVYRRNADGKLKEVFHTTDLQKAKYWLQYIAEVGDVLMKTPAHPKNTGGRPEYWSHKEYSGQAVSSKEKWMHMHSLTDFDSIVPAEQTGE